jgi:regulator of protease activity HflC (stomatin/prohibitin superfamily)
LFVAYSGFTARVDAGEACAVTRFGDITRVAGPGLQIKLPFVERYHCYRTAATFFEVLDEQDRSEADFTSGPLDGVTRDGQPVTLTFNLRYLIPRGNVTEIYSQIGRTDTDVNERVVKFHSRSIVRQFIQQYSSAELYSGDLAAVSQRMQDELSPLFAESYITLQYFEIKRPRFDPAYEQAISQKQIARERIETAANEAEAAEQDAVRAANIAQGESDAQRIRAEGEAEAIRLRGQAVRDNPEIIQLNYIDALRTINWAILDSGDVNQFLAITPPAGNPAQGGQDPAVSPTAAAAGDPVAQQTPIPTETPTP